HSEVRHRYQTGRCEGPGAQLRRSADHAGQQGRDETDLHGVSPGRQEDEMTDADSDASRGGGTRYDRQLIVALTGGDGGTTSAQAEALGRKLREPPLPSEVVTVHRKTASERSADVGELRLA